MLRMGHTLYSFNGLRLLIPLLLCSLVTGWANAEDPLEAAAKAAYVVNFAHFTTWPDDAFADASTPIDLIVYGGERTRESFKSIDGQKAGEREIRVHLMRPAETIDHCHLIFFDQDVDYTFLSTVLNSVRGRPVLTIGETPDFIGLGGIVNIFYKDERLHFNVKPARASRRGLKISSRLLKLADNLDD